MAEIDNRLQSNSAAADVLSELSGLSNMEVRGDQLSRALYATDASLYEIMPDGVVLPRDREAVIACVRACARNRVPITARGAGTGLAGGAVNRGVQLDCSRYLNHILEIEPEARTARVEPGVVLDELNARLKPHGLHFAPDVATSSRATIGGMIANNSCGAHSVRYGRTVDHVLSMDVILSDGSQCRWGRGESANGNPLATRCERELTRISTELKDEIAARYPRVLRRNGGYALDRLNSQDGSINAETIICGSEGTLAIVVEAKLNLVPLPASRGLVVAHFSNLLDALTATPVILEHEPAAIELVDQLILKAAMQQPAMARRASAIEGQPEALLVIELYGDDDTTVRSRLQKVAAELESRQLGYAWPVLTDLSDQADIWEIRKSGLGLLMSRPGAERSFAFVEDSAVDPSKLRAYIERFAAILAEEGVTEVGYYAHASVGCLHVRPVLSLGSREGVERMHRIADRVSSLAMEFGGTMTGEHGDGIVRSCWLEKMYGPRIIDAFREIKDTFDPQGIFNPGKIVSPLPMTESLRSDYGAKSAVPTRLNFDRHGGLLGMASMCSGVGQCRQRLVGTMCPSYMATGDEQDTTRARANALRLALANPDMIDGLSDPALDDVMDLCLSCKACKAECPTGVDMARMKSEWLWHRYQKRGASLRDRLIAVTPSLVKFASLVPALTNALAGASWMRRLMDRVLGIEHRVPPPRFASQTFHRWFELRRPLPGDRPTVVYLADTWTNYFLPQVGIATVLVLEELGYHVIAPRFGCCGRPAISKGRLDHARRAAAGVVTVLGEYAMAGTPIIGTEPSCLLTLADEVPQLIQTEDSQAIAKSVVTVEAFLSRSLDEALIERLSPLAEPILFHGHCHQKASVGTTDAMQLLCAASGDRATEINSGCCGMAGSFGHESEHYEVATAVGEQRLFPAVRARNNARIAVSGFSCRHQIEHHTGITPSHVIELVAEAMGLSSGL